MPEVPLLSFRNLCGRFDSITKPSYESRQKRQRLDEGIHTAYGFNKDFQKKDRAGDKRLERLLQTIKRLEKLGWNLSIQQRKMLNGMICATLPQIMQEDLQPRMAELMERFDIKKKLKTEVLIKATRRLGKTTIAAFFIACYCDSQPEAQADIYSVAKRTSVMFLAKVVSLLISLHGGDTGFIKTFNQETFQFVNQPGTISTVHSYPSASKIDKRTICCYPLLLLLLLFVYIYFFLLGGRSGENGHPRFMLLHSMDTPGEQAKK